MNSGARPGFCAFWFFKSARRYLVIIYEAGYYLISNDHTNVNNLSHQELENVIHQNLMLIHTRKILHDKVFTLIYPVI